VKLGPKKKGKKAIQAASVCVYFDCMRWELDWIEVTGSRSIAIFFLSILYLDKGDQWDHRISWWQCPGSQDPPFLATDIPSRLQADYAVFVDALSSATGSGLSRSAISFQYLVNVGHFPYPKREGMSFSLFLHWFRWNYFPCQGIIDNPNLQTTQTLKIATRRSVYFKWVRFFWPLTY